MSDVIWTLYLADVVQSLAVCFGIGGFAAFLTAGFAKITTAIDEEPSPPWTKTALIIGAVCWGLGSLLPSKTTLYAIAATQVGEKALQTDTGDKALKAFNAWLDRQIEDGGESK